ncbi:MAG: Nif3-like dinuclear metal center hexameric protein [Pirellula sp.]|jgi:dinuclear metal center YbgI/SA1388 family protein|nr:Nif3-like dinuclear metal center hexameric protein [Pirellula sp.]
MTNLSTLMAGLNSIAPLSLAESWDNVGLLLGDANRTIHTAMTCLTLTQPILEEAIAEKVDLVIPHHPIPFKPLNRLTTGTPTGSVLLKAAENRIAIYCAHTAWDNAENGINRQLADLLQLTNIEPLVPAAPPNPNHVGSGRCGIFSTPVDAARLRSIFADKLGKVSFRQTHSIDRQIRRVGIVCGSGGSCLDLAAQKGCDCFLTGEATYHQCLEAEARDICLIQVGHHASEFFAMQRMAQLLAKEFSAVRFLCSQSESSDF